MIKKLFLIDPSVKGAMSEYFDKSQMSETIDVPAERENTVVEEHSLLLFSGRSENSDWIL